MVPTPGKSPLQFWMRMKVKRAMSSGKAGLATLLPTMGEIRSKMPSTMLSTMACEREGMSLGVLVARRMAMISTSATTQLVTMLLVTGMGPMRNSASAEADTPPSLAKAGRLVAKTEKIRASFLTRDMNALEGGKLGKVMT